MTLKTLGALLSVPHYSVPPKKTSFVCQNSRDTCMQLKFYCTQFVAGPESYLLVCLLFSCHHAFRHKESMKLDERYSSLALKGLTTCTPTDTTDVRPLIQYQILKCFLTVISTPESEYCTTQFVQAILAEKAHNFLRFVC